MSKELGVPHTGLGASPANNGVASINPAMQAMYELLSSRLMTGQLSPWMLLEMEYYFETYPIIQPAGTTGTQTIFNGNSPQQYPIAVACNLLRNNSSTHNYQIQLNDVVGPRLNFIDRRIIQIQGSEPVPQRWNPLFFLAGKTLLQINVKHDVPVPIGQDVNDTFTVMYARKRQTAVE